MGLHTGSFVAPGGVTLFHQSWTPDAEAKADVLLVHGFAEHSSRYGHVADGLVARGYAVHALDLRGHGRSGGPRALVDRFGQYARDLRAFHDEVATRGGIRPHILLGHSMGAAVAVGYLIGSHRPVDALVCSAAFLRSAVPTPAPLRVAAPLIGALAPRLPTQPIDASAISKDPAVVQAYDTDPLVYRGKVKARMGAHLLALGDALLPRAGAVTVPSLLLHGDHDRIADIEGSRQLLAALGSTDKRLKEYPGLYHELLQEPERDQVLADIGDWMDDHVDG